MEGLEVILVEDLPSQNPLYAHFGVTKERAEDLAKRAFAEANGRRTIAEGLANLSKVAENANEVTFIAYMFGSAVAELSMSHKMNTIMGEGEDNNVIGG